MILLGATVRDKSTGFEGVAVSRVEYMNGCTQYGVRPRYTEDMKGEYPKVEYIDQEQLEDVSKEVRETAEKDSEEPPGGLQSARPRK